MEIRIGDNRKQNLMTTRTYHTNNYEAASAKRTERGSKNSAKMGKCEDG
jgi:hypothetical protein